MNNTMVSCIFALCLVIFIITLLLALFENRQNENQLKWCNSQTSMGWDDYKMCIGVKGFKPYG